MAMGGLVKAVLHPGRVRPHPSRVLREAGMAERRLTTTVSAKGRVMLPEAIRERMGWGVGTRFAVEQTTEGVLLRAGVAVFAATRGEDVFGCLGPVAEARSVEEMEAGIGEEVRRRWARGRY